ncbi:FHA domain-containing protein [Listeria booriae]|uniref:FHA domain-containing protein n=1 Tax=Listeria booriae TaxID=1552123 RepID=A0A7X0Z1U1_9LIST|nr:FHA domain-containing protein [Listeria booriae]MBC2167688.1 FHA domain-containing protein [Listeria booriae]
MKKILIIDYMLSAFFILGAGYSFYNAYAWSITLGLAIVGCAIFVYTISSQIPRKRISNVKVIALLDADGEILKEWHISGKSGLLIGKSYKNDAVDIDLADTDYAVLVAHEHAVLNFVEGQWYIEDLGSRNGTGIKSKQASKIKRLAEKETYQIQSGDRIYIAKTLLEIN